MRPHTPDFRYRRSGIRSWGLWLLLVWCATAVAAPSPLDVVRDTSERLLAAVRAQKAEIRTNPQRLHQLVEDILLPVVDRARVTRYVLGKYWRQANPEQQTRFTQEFQKLLIRTYSAPLLDHTDVSITYLPFRTEPGAHDSLVRTQIRRPGAADPLAVDYRLHDKDGTWKVYDVIVGGVSAVATFRSAFSSEIQKTGLDAFIQSLARKNGLDS